MKKIMRNRTLAVLDAAFLVIYTIWCVLYYKGILTGRPLYGENELTYNKNAIVLVTLLLGTLWMLLFSSFFEFATVVTIDHEKIKTSFLFIELTRMYWADVKCVGLIEQGILREKSRYKRSIYISDEIPDLRKRLLMCAELYETDKSEHRIHLRYTKQDLELIRSIWEGPYIIDTAEKFYNDKYIELDRRISELDEENKQLKLQKAILL